MESFLCNGGSTPQPERPQRAAAERYHDALRIGALAAEGQHERRVAIDTGSEICAISESALRHDMCLLLQAEGAHVRELAEPVSIKLFDGQMSSTKKVVTNAKILIGCVQVRVDFFVMPNGCAEYLLGGGVVADCDIRLVAHEHRASISTHESARSVWYPDPHVKYPPRHFQTIPLYWRRVDRKFPLKPVGNESSSRPFLLLYV